jgi:dihydrofolate reductase
MKSTVFVGVSLDGYIAREDGRLDWLMSPEIQAVDYGYNDFIATVDVVVMGRGTFETVLGFDPWPYSKPVVALSSRALSIPQHLAGKAESMSGTPAQVVERLAQRGAQHLYVDGGETITRFLNARLIDELVISRLPVLIGSGIPLFGRLDHDVRLRLLSSREFPGGMVQSRYAVAR